MVSTATKFKVGDRVKRVTGPKIDGMEVGDVGTVSAVFNEWIGIEEFPAENNDRTPFIAGNFKLASPAFPIGQRVTLTVDNDGYGAKGDAGSVIGYVEDDIRVRFDRSIRGQHDWLVSAGRLGEEKWVPKVGDRVSYKDDYARGVGVINSENADAADKQYFGWMVEVDEKDREFAYYVNGKCRKFATSALQPLPVAAPQPTAPLTIQAGRYYKTRDGRKVGPMVDGGGFWRIDGPGNGSPGHYTSDGISAFRGILTRDGDRKVHDLIAEWPATSANTAAEEYGPVVAPVVAASNDNAVPKFKVGDRVKFRDDYGSSSRGKEATVIAMNVWGDDGVQVDQGGSGGISTESASDLRLVVPTPTAIVALIENGQPKPATHPHVHASEADASVEAQRLANLHKGQRFGVYVLSASTEVAASIYEHEWQRLADNGQKIAAIKELRSLTGLNLAAAKTAVEKWLDYELAAA